MNKKLLANGGEIKLVEPQESAKGLFQVTDIPKVLILFKQTRMHFGVLIRSIKSGNIQ